MNNKQILTLVVAVAAAFFCGWMLKPETKTVRRGSRAGGAGDPVESAELERVRAELATAQNERKALEAKLEQLSARAEEPAEADTKPKATAEPVEHGPRFVFEGYGDALKEIDWQVIGESLNAMPPLMEEYFDALANDKPIPPSVGEIQRYNGPLITQALKLQAGGLPGEGVNGVFTHPVAQVNMVYATLQQAGKPLNGQQQQQLGDIGARFFELDKQRLAAYDESTLGLVRLLEETALKDRFYEAVDALLTPEQRTVLHPAATKGYVSADLFSSGLVWGSVAAPLGVTGPEDLAAQVLGQVMVRMKLDESTGAQAKQAVDAWANTVPLAFLKEPMTSATRNRMMQVTRVRKAAELQLKLVQALLRHVKLDDAQTANLRQSRAVFVPYSSAGG